MLNAGELAAETTISVAEYDAANSAHHTKWSICQRPGIHGADYVQASGPWVEILKPLVRDVRERMPDGALVWESRIDVEDCPEGKLVRYVADTVDRYVAPPVS